MIPEHINSRGQPQALERTDETSRFATVDRAQSWLTMTSRGNPGQRTLGVFAVVAIEGDGYGADRGAATFNVSAKPDALGKPLRRIWSTAKSTL